MWKNFTMCYSASRCQPMFYPGGCCLQTDILTLEGDKLRLLRCATQEEVNLLVPKA